MLDVANGTSGTGVALYVYRKTDTISPSFDTVVVTLTNTIVLPLTGGSNTHAYMAANAGFLIIGTDQSGVIAKVARSKFIVTSFSPFSSNISAITSNKYGYVTVAFGTSGTGSAANIILGPNGATVSDEAGYSSCWKRPRRRCPQRYRRLRWKEKPRPVAIASRTGHPCLSFIINSLRGLHGRKVAAIYSGFFSTGALQSSCVRF